MAFIDGNNGLTAADVAAVTGANNGGFGMNGDGAWLILILLLFAAFGGNGWGNNGGTNDMQRGFDQQAVMGSLGAIQGSMADAALASANNTASILAGMNAGNNAILMQMGNYEMARQQCCCDTKAAIADLKYTVATEACADRQTVSDGIRDVIQNQNSNTQAILDKLCQQEIDALKAQNANLQTQINLANLQASQGNQTAQILADNAAQTAALRQVLNPTPVPAYVVQNPNGCGCYQYAACAC